MDNQQRWSLVVGGVIAILATAGIAIAAYLYYIHVSQVGCNLGGGCDVVNTSIYSEMFGIPVAAYGLGYYTFVLVLALVRLQGALGERMPLVLTLVSAWGVLYSLYLFYLELFVIHAICPWCVIQMLAVMLIFGIALVDWRLARRA